MQCHPETRAQLDKLQEQLFYGGFHLCLAESGQNLRQSVDPCSKCSGYKLPKVKPFAAKRLTITKSGCLRSLLIRCYDHQRLGKAPKALGSKKMEGELQTLQVWSKQEVFASHLLS
jgi:hypothetical protein